MTMKLKLLKDGLVLISESEEEDTKLFELFSDGMILHGKAVSNAKTDNKRKQLLMMNNIVGWTKLTKRKTKFE